MRPLLHPADHLVQTMQRIYRTRMTTTSGGNLSIRDEDDRVWITPARVDKGSLTREDIVSVDAQGTTTGRHPASSELPFHQAIYNMRSDLKAIVHAHPVALVAFSVARQKPPTRLFHQAYDVCGEVGFAPYALPGSARLGRNIAEAFAEGIDSVILENHGIVVGGATLSEAFQRFEALEFVARTALEATSLGEAHLLSDAELAAAAARTTDVTPTEQPSASATERELRYQLRTFIERGCRQRLLISTEGSFSARLGPDSFLITPSQRDRELLTIDDFVLVDGNNCEPDKRPSRATSAHRAIYAAHPEIRSIVFAHPVHATAFSVTDATFDARTIPESYIFLRQVERVPYGVHFSSREDAGSGMSIADHVSTDKPVAILQNDGVLVTGKSVFDAFDRLEVMESTAEAILRARALGEVHPMNDDVIDELEQEFLS